MVQNSRVYDMNNKNKTLSHREVENLAKKRAEEFQPSIKRWLTKSSAATQRVNIDGSLSACIANNFDKDKINNETFCFENKVRNWNKEYNAKIKAFKRSDETFKILTANMNSVITFPKRQKNLESPKK